MIAKLSASTIKFQALGKAHAKAWQIDIRATKKKRNFINLPKK